MSIFNKLIPTKTYKKFPDVPKKHWCGYQLNIVMKEDLLMGMQIQKIWEEINF